MNPSTWSPFADAWINDEKGRTLAYVSRDHRSEFEVRQIRDMFLASPMVKEALERLLTAVALKADGKLLMELQDQITYAELALKESMVKLPKEMIKPA